MKLGIFKYFIIIFLFSFTSLTFSADKIQSVPLVNLENLKPSYENEDEDYSKTSEELDILKEKSENSKDTSTTSINVVALDKITAKTSNINIKIGETKKFGLLEIKAVDCGKTESLNEKGDVAYIQVKDITDNSNEKIYVFNGWTFSSSPSLKPIDHPVYDVWLVNCENI
ncbi:MAG: DUF2155 domain-containing protein [Pelagibacteraceae bacterium]